MYSQDPQKPRQDWPQLVDAARNGCDDALSEIITRLQGYLLLIANGQMRENLQAKFGASDIVQNSLVDAHAGIYEFKGTTEAEMRAWLRRIVMHNLVDEGRRYTGTQARNINREQSLDLMASPLAMRGSSAASKLMRQEAESLLLSQAVHRLSPRQQRVVEARSRFGYSYAQIAEQMGITEEAARKHFSRALEQLKIYCAEKD